MILLGTSQVNFASSSSDFVFEYEETEMICSRKGIEIDPALLSSQHENAYRLKRK